MGSPPLRCRVCPAQAQGDDRGSLIYQAGRLGHLGIPEHPGGGVAHIIGRNGVTALSLRLGKELEKGRTAETRRHPNQGQSHQGLYQGYTSLIVPHRFIFIPSSTRTVFTPEVTVTTTF